MKFIFRFAVFTLLWIHYLDPSSLNAQISLNDRIAQATFSLEKPQEHKRKAINLKNKSILVKINPLSYLGVGLLYFYQNVVSEQFSADCSYKISCSENAKRAIERYGLIKGVLLGAQQLNACIPGVRAEHSDHTVVDGGKVYINLEDYD